MCVCVMVSNNLFIRNDVYYNNITDIAVYCLDR